MCRVTRAGTKLAAQRRLNFELNELVRDPNDFTLVEKILYKSPSDDSEWGEYERNLNLSTQHRCTVVLSEKRSGDGVDREGDRLAEDRCQLAE